MVGQNLGAGNPERAERAVWLAAKVSAGILLAAAVVSFAFPEPIVSVFMATGTEQAAATIDHGSEFLRIAALMFVFMGVLQVVLGAYRGAGNTKTAMVFSMVTLWAGSLAMSYVLVAVVGMGPRGIWIGYSLGDILGAVVATLWFTRGTWKHTVIDDRTAEPECPVAED